MGRRSIRPGQMRSKIYLAEKLHFPLKAPGVRARRQKLNLDSSDSSCAQRLISLCSSVQALEGASLSSASTLVIQLRFVESLALKREFPVPEEVLCRG